VWHLDLNARNLLLEGDGMRVIDLDRARTDVADRARAERAMTSRLARSLRKFEGRTGRALQAEEWLAFDSAAPTDPSEA
jgi:3-deoxy-D-manno-octulosonic acid kinase